MSHDPETYHDPFTFRPERFLEEDGSPVELDPLTLAFGFGRRYGLRSPTEVGKKEAHCVAHCRICPGMVLAVNSLFIAIAMSIAVFDISKARDETGKEIDPVHEFQAGLNRQVTIYYSDFAQIISHLWLEPIVTQNLSIALLRLVLGKQSY